MSDDLVKILRADDGDWRTNQAADRIEELEAIIRQLTEIGNTQTKPGDLSAGLPNSINDTAP